MIEAAAKGNPLHLSYHYKDLLFIILKDLQSPLAAQHLSRLFLQLHETVFNKNSLLLGQLIAHVTLRLYKPQCDLEAAWEEENLEKTVKRTMSLIHSKIFEANDDRYHFPAPTFCYVFPFLKIVMLSKQAKKDEALIHDGLQIVTRHAQLRGKENDEEIEKYHPKYLPRKEMFEVLIELISEYFN